MWSSLLWQWHFQLRGRFSTVPLEVSVHTASETPAARSLSSRHGFAYQVTHVEFKIGRGLSSVYSVDLQGWMRKGKGAGDPEGGIGGVRDPREWPCGLQKV